MDVLRLGDPPDSEVNLVTSSPGLESDELVRSLGTTRRVISQGVWSGTGGRQNLPQLASPGT